jgi:hypothetical protein
MLKQQQRLIAGLFGLALAASAAAQTATTPPAGQPASAAKSVAPATAAPDSDVQARIRENEEKLARAAAEEAKRAAVIKAYEDEQAERMKQLAREKEERDARRARAAYESQCQFKSVMSDEDIARCKAVHRN